jgi:hypothetical protein
MRRSTRCKRGSLQGRVLIPVSPRRPLTDICAWPVIFATTPLRDRTRRPLSRGRRPGPCRGVDGLVSWPLASFLTVALVLAAGWVAYERGRPSARMTAAVAVLAAVATLGRDAFAALPDVKPITAITRMRMEVTWSPAPANEPTDAASSPPVPTTSGIAQTTAAIPPSALAPAPLGQPRTMHLPGLLTSGCALASGVSARMATPSRNLPLTEETP